MPKIKINNVEYDVDKLSREAQLQLKMYKLAEAELERLKNLQAVVQTAINAYAVSIAKSVNNGK